MRAPWVLIAAGHEPTGRVGLLVDVATVQGLGVAAAGVATALTAQGRRARVEPVRPAMIEAQVASALEHFGAPPAVVKLGLVPDRGALTALRRALRGVDCEWVVDPVVRSSAGVCLSRLTPRDYLALARVRAVLTPNAVEAGWLLQRPPITDRAGAEDAAAELCARGFGAVVIKGGHLRGAAADLLATREQFTWLRATRLRRTRAHRGTGCRFACALAAHRAMGAELRSAVRNAKAWVREFIAILPASS